MKILKYIIWFFIWSIPIVMFGYVLLIRSNLFSSVNKNQPFELISDMDNTISLKQQSENILSKKKVYESLKPDKSISYTHPEYKYESIDIEKSVSNGDNPLPMTKEVFNRGKHLFNTHCVYCHNNNGKGEGIIVSAVKLKAGEEPFPGPPDLTRQQAIDYPDSRMFHVLSAGQNLMFPVAYKLDTIDRHCLVKYLRILQGVIKYDK
jgi:hypothetical protein